MEAILIVAFHDDLKLEWYKIQQTELVIKKSNLFDMQNILLILF